MGGEIATSQYADTESVTNLPFSASGSFARNFAAELVFHATPSNNVEMSFGVDDDHDGRLTVRETRFSFGYDCGEWFARDLSIRIAEPSSSSNRTRRLSLSLRANGAGETRMLSLADSTSPILVGDASSIGEFAFDPRWDVARVAVRGFGAGQVSFEARVFSDGLKVVVR